MDPVTQSSELNFDAAPAIEQRQDVPVGPDRIHAASASGLSVVLAVLLVVTSLTGARFLAAASKARQSQDPVSKSLRFLGPEWHALSLLVASFLGLNVLFGGLTALLLNGKSEDAASYFAEISALKLTRLSHEHFFGYGVLFGLMAALAFVFVGGGKKRVLFPVLLTFSFSALDSASWWLARYVSLGFHTLSFLTGGIFAAAFLSLYVQIARVNLIAIVRGARAQDKDKDKDQK